VAGGWRQVDLLQRNANNFMVLTLPQEMDEVAPYRERAPWALGIVGAMLGLMTIDVLPAVSHLRSRAGVDRPQVEAAGNRSRQITDNKEVWS
jgi:hypothetical protein